MRITKAQAQRDVDSEWNSKFATLVLSYAQDWMEYEAQVVELQEQNYRAANNNQALWHRAEEAYKLLHGLTPMGSDYAGNPQKCADWIRHHQTQLTDMLVTAKAEAAALRAQLTEAQVECEGLQQAYDKIYHQKWGDYPEPMRGTKG
jgi:hypothetical protein